MTFTADDIPDQTGRVAIVTGGTAGLGLHSVIELARKGCHVIFTARSTARGQEALEKIKAALETESLGNVEFAIANQEDLESIAAFADAFLARNLHLHILLLNAGQGAQPYRVVQGVEALLFLNHVAHQLLATRLLPALKRSAPSRVVIVSSMAHSFTKKLDLDLPSEDRYDSQGAYSLTKVANIMMGHSLIKDIGHAKVYVNSLHPGVVSTEITRSGNAITTLPWGIRGILESFFTFCMNNFGYKPEVGALTQLYVATSPDIEKNEWQGQYFTPIAQLGEASALSRDPQQIDRLWKWTNDVIARVMS
ncbi:unnamed protein product [Aphanomyces euteiches]